MAKSKYNWELRKQEFIVWDIEWIREFLEWKLGAGKVNNWNVDKQTKWRKEARKKYWKDILDNYEAPIEALVKLKDQLDEGIKFLPTLIKSYIVWVKSYINKKGKYPSIDEVTKFAKLLENYSGFKLGSDFTINLTEEEDEDYLKERLASIRARKWSRTTKQKWI